jgi:hypothetical protein
MGCVATGVMGPRLVYLSENSSGPLNRMPKVWNDGIVSMDNIYNFLSEINHYYSVLYYRWFTTLKVIRKEMNCNIIFLV